MINFWIILFALFLSSCSLAPNIYKTDNFSNRIIDLYLKDDKYLISEYTELVIMEGILLQKLFESMILVQS